MNLESLFPVLIFVVFAFVVGTLIIKSIKYGGLRAAMFGAPIEHTVGEVLGNGPKFMNIAIRVHILGGASADKAIGLEFTAKSFASYQMLPVTLSASGARELATLLMATAEGHDAT